MVILLLALLVLGPDKLPEYTRKAGRYMNEFRRMTSGFQEEFRSAMDLGGIDHPRGRGARRRGADRGRRRGAPHDRGTPSHAAGRSTPTDAERSRADAAGAPDPDRGVHRRCHPCARHRARADHPAPARRRPRGRLGQLQCGLTAACTRERRTDQRASAGGHMTIWEHLAELRSRLIKVRHRHGRRRRRRLVPVPVPARLPAASRSSEIQPDTRPDRHRAAAGRSPCGCKMSAYIGIAFAMPVILWQVWRFITPGAVPAGEAVRHPVHRSARCCCS